MGKSKLHLLLLISMTLLFQGCQYSKLVKPEPQVRAIEPLKSLDKPKFSYYIYNLHYNRATKDADKALVDSFSAYGISDGISDVIKSEKLERDRINIFVYVLETRNSDIERYIGIPWALISIGTLAAVPNYSKIIHPVEIHIITPNREYDKQVKIIRTEYVTANWVWLPLVFASKDESREDVSYGGLEGMRKLDYLGLRRVFDAIIIETMQD